MEVIHKVSAVEQDEEELRAMEMDSEGFMVLLGRDTYR